MACEKSAIASLNRQIADQQQHQTDLTRQNAEADQKNEIIRVVSRERLAPVPLQTVTLRHVPSGVTDEAHLAAHNLAIARKVNDGGRAYLTPSVLKGQQTLRISVGAEATERRHLEALWLELQDAAHAVGG